MKLCQRRFRLGIRKKFFHPKGDWALEQGPQGSGHSTRLTNFKKHLYKVPRHMVWFLWYSVQDQELDLMILMDTFQLSIFYDSVILIWGPGRSTCYLLPLVRIAEFWVQFNYFMELA